MTLRESKNLAKLYRVPLTLRERKETTGKKELIELYEKTGDPLIATVLELRSLDTTINNYLPNWKPGRDSRVHPKFSFGAPTGQLATKEPNSQNASTHTDEGQWWNYGQEFRRIIECPVGYCFVEFDYQRFHVATMGYRAKDPTYLRFARLDSHSIFTSYFIGNGIKPIEFNWSESDIKEACREIKRRFPLNRQSQAKPTVLGNQLGLGPIKLQRQNRRHIKTVAEAKRLQAIIADRFPKVELHKGQVRDLAHRQTYLLNEWGYIQYFFDVYNFKFNKRTGSWDKGHGSDMEKVLAFDVQSPAHGMLKDKILEGYREGFCDEFNFCSTIHDSVGFMPEVGKRDRCIEEMYKIMVKPCRVLSNEVCPEGLSVGVDVKVGRNWQAKGEGNLEGMEEIKI